mgnify:CR=1 FL=1
MVPATPTATRQRSHLLLLVVGQHCGGPAMHGKCFASLTIITAWTIWKHRNPIIFVGMHPSNSQLLNIIMDEARRWARAGAKGLDRIIPIA